MKTLFILNPVAGHGRARRRWEGLIGSLRQALPEMELWHTRGPGDGAALARRGLEQSFEALVAVGGDGTLGEVVDGFLSAPGPQRAGAAVGTWPAGSGCDTARHLGLSMRDPATRLVAMLRARRLQRLDAGRLLYTDDAGATRSRHFINVAAFGLAGTVARRLERSGKRWGGTASYLLSTLQALLSARPDPIELEVDGRPEPSVELFLGAVANAASVGGGMLVAPGADMEDGWLDLLTVGKRSRFQLLRTLPKVYRGEHLTAPGVALRKVKRVVARAAGEVWLNVDGEALGKLPCVFEVLPRALPFLMPP
ncbi:MAG: diacylglycerol kinase family lipid kinase [Elusimicrobia bacterium]|nr:diacylglycerol kinase family lipid kinase [Elusimicrobiota bacterium]